jgi:DNA-binding PadR family transcriptional regulator
MPALDDYDSPAPLWMVICAALERAPGGELSITKLHEAVLKDARGLWFASYNNVTRTCRRMRNEGLLQMRIAGRKRQAAQMQRLTKTGREMFLEARECAHSLLDTTKKKA